MVTTQNQTDQGSLSGLDAQTKGFGIFAVPDPTSPDFGAVNKVLFEDITYGECLMRGYFTVAFKWMPKRPNQGKVALAACPVVGTLCVTDCGAIEMCLCIQGRCT